MRVQHEYRLLGPDGWHEHHWGPSRPANAAMVRHRHGDESIHYHYHPELDAVVADTVLANGHNAHLAPRESGQTIDLIPQVTKTGPAKAGPR